MLKKLGIGISALVASAVIALGAGYFPGWPIVGEGQYCVVNVNGSCQSFAPAGPSSLSGNELIPADTQNAAGVNPATVLIPPNVVAGASAGTPRNLLGNGALNITTTNGTSTVTCATTSAPTTAALSADRWMCDANVTSGVGRTAIVTSSPSPPAGFGNVMKVWRLSGALTQPVCTWSAVPSAAATQLAGRTVTFQAQLAALAGLAADNGGVVNLVIISGTGTDEGLNGSWTTSPAITPAWTGIALAVNAAQNVSTTFARYAVSAAIPSAATEVGVAICFTPTATGAGATDGFAWTGAQLEVGPAPSAFEIRQKADEARDALQYFYKITEGAVGSVRAPCTSSTTSLEVCLLQFPVPMYKAPTMGYTAGFASCTTTACSALQACTVVRTSTVITGLAVDSVRAPLDCTSTTGFPAAGSATFLADDAGSGIITAWTGL